MKNSRARMAVLAVRPAEAATPPLSADGTDITAETLMIRDGWQVVRYRFDLPVGGDTGYRFEGEDYPVRTDLDGGAMRIAFVSCNGQEEGDLDRAPADRNRLWHALGQEHAERPFSLLLQGGDQIYADEVMNAHPAVRHWGDHDRPRPVNDATVAEAEEALTSAFLTRYMTVLGQSEPAHVMARVPGLAIWDDHDICDGWGSLPARKLDSPIGQALFRTARRFFLLFQMATTPEDLPAHCTDPEGRSLGWRLHLPGLSIVAPDLRSERRPRQVMGEAGWRGLARSLEEAEDAGAKRILVLSSVPALGPRLSWVELAMVLTPSMQEYEDDLRDQWQSRFHRREWQHFLRALIARHGPNDQRVTVLSGEIHLATRGELRTDAGPLHQLVASGITHPTPPRGYARGLGLLSLAGARPLKDHPIRLHPLPGQRKTYMDERNYLTLERAADGVWRANWVLEESGRTPNLSLA